MSTPSKEIEFKFAVEGKYAFEHLVSQLGLPLSVLQNAVTQINHFYDSAAYCLHQRHFVIRLREQSDRHFLTIKGEQQADANTTSVLTSRIEEEVALCRESAEALLAGTVSPQQIIKENFSDRSPSLLQMIETACNQQELVHIGDFRNVRIHLPPVLLAVGRNSERLEFELDSSTFPDGKVEYEVEIEISEHSDADAIEAALKDLFRQAGIQWHTAPSKAERFFTAISN
jgi:uncharacterized protein YjbK